MANRPDDKQPNAVGGTAFADSRRVRLRGAHNVRDIGGYKTIDGRLVKRGLLYRADGLHRLTQKDVQTLDSLGIQSAVDFREEKEHLRKPDRLPAGVRQTWLPIDVGGYELRQEVRAAIAGTAEGDLSDVMVRVGRELIEGHSKVYAAWLAAMATEDDALPQIFHCTAGKDRTGLAAALLLRILGVPSETVIEDYELSNRYLDQLSRRVIRRVRLVSLFRADGKVIRPLLVADRRYLQASFDAIHAGWGNFDSYVEAGLGLGQADVEKLKARILE